MQGCNSCGFYLVLFGIACMPAANAQTEPDMEDAKKPLWEIGLAGFGLNGPA